MHQVVGRFRATSARFPFHSLGLPSVFGIFGVTQAVMCGSTLTWYRRESGWLRRIQILSRRKWLAMKAMTFFMLMRLPARLRCSVLLAAQSTCT